MDINDLKAKLDTANQRIFELTQELRNNYHNHNGEIEKLNNALKEAQAIADSARKALLKSRDNTRNAKERAQRFKKRITKLEQEITRLNGLTSSSHKHEPVPNNGVMLEQQI